MRCHNCNQNSININLGHISCEICGLDIVIDSDSGSSIYDLFIYNENLESAEKLGEDAYLQELSLEDNPYSTSSNQISFNQRWIFGYNKVKESDEKAALSLSIENLQKAIEELNKDKKEMIASHYSLLDKYSDIKKEYGDLQTQTLELSQNNYILGRTYKKELIGILMKSSII